MIIGPFALLACSGPPVDKAAIDARLRERQAAFATYDIQAVAPFFGDDFAFSDVPLLASLAQSSHDSWGRLASMHCTAADVTSGTGGSVVVAEECGASVVTNSWGVGESGEWEAVEHLRWTGMAMDLIPFGPEAFTPPPAADVSPSVPVPMGLTGLIELSPPFGDLGRWGAVGRREGGCGPVESRLERKQDGRGKLPDEASSGVSNIHVDTLDRDGTCFVRVTWAARTHAAMEWHYPCVSKQCAPFQDAARDWAEIQRLRRAAHPSTDERSKALLASDAVVALDASQRRLLEESAGANFTKAEFLAATIDSEGRPEHANGAQCREAGGRTWCLRQTTMEATAEAYALWFAPDAPPPIQRQRPQQPEVIYELEGFAPFNQPWSTAPAGQVELVVEHGSRRVRIGATWVELSW